MHKNTQETNYLPQRRKEYKGSTIFRGTLEGHFPTPFFAREPWRTRRKAKTQPFRQLATKTHKRHKNTQETNYLPQRRKEYKGSIIFRGPPEGHFPTPFFAREPWRTRRKAKAGTRTCNPLDNWPQKRTKCTKIHKRQTIYHKGAKNTKEAQSFGVHLKTISLHLFLTESHGERQRLKLKLNPLDNWPQKRTKCTKIRLSGSVTSQNCHEGSSAVATHCSPNAVNRYFCNRLVGLLGTVISRYPASKAGFR